MQEGRTSIHLDARRAGVVVPEHLKNEAHLVLQYGIDLPIPIPDLQVDEQGVSATLSFARCPYQTAVPWSAVYVVVSDDGRGVLYHEDIPKDVSVNAARESEASTGESDPGLALAMAPRPTPTRALRAVPMGGSMQDAAVDMVDRAQVDEIPVRRKKRPQLRLVK